MKEPKPRGRPKSGAALTATERTRRLADKARLALEPDTALSDLADSALLLALPQAFRAQRADAFARITAELSRRLSVASTDIQPAGDSVDPTINDPVIFVEPTDNHPASLPVKPTDIQSAVNLVEPTNIPAPFTLAPAAPTEPLSARDARILALAGLSEKKVAAILNAEGIKCSPRTVGYVRSRRNSKDAGAV